MSSLANCNNHSTRAVVREFHNKNENETMMHKVKDVVSKFLHPSFLFSTDNETDRSKRKRSGSPEKNNNEQQIEPTGTTTITTSSYSNNRYSSTKDDGAQLTDDEDNNSRDVPSAEQEKKRRRTANYQSVASTNIYLGDDKPSPSTSSSTDTHISSTSTTPILHHHTTTQQNYYERINRSKQRYPITSTYRGSTLNYDPSKSPLFSTGKHNTTNLQSNEFSANHLLATSLTNRSQSSISNHQPSSATLTNPVSNQRHMLGGNYTSNTSRRLPYIERLRQRTLKDCIRHNHTLDSQPASVSAIEEQKSITTSPVSKRLKVPEKECGIQCDIPIVETSQTSERITSPIDSQIEVSSAPIIPQIQTNSSITIEKKTSSIPSITITKPKVLGDITPFSWPKFARAQQEYAIKYPEKCRRDAVVPSLIGKASVNTSATIYPSINTTTMPKIPFLSSRPTEPVWKCPCCTKEHAVQTASCSLCHGINPNYKKLSAIKPAEPVEKEQVASTVIAKEPSISTPVIPVINQTTTKENVLSTSSPVITTSTITTAFPSFGTTPVTTKENTTINFSAPIFGIASTTSTQNTSITTAPVTTSSPILRFGVTPSPVTTTTANPVLSSTFPPMFGTTPIAFPTTIPKENPVATNDLPLFGVTTAKENPTTTSAQLSFGTIPFNKSLTPAPTTTTSNSFQIGTSFPSFASLPSTNLTAIPTSSAVPSTVGMTLNLPPSIPFGSFGSTTVTTAPTSTTVSSNPSTTFAVPFATSASSLTASTSTAPNLFGFSTVTPVSSTSTTSMFPVLPSTSTFSSPSNFMAAPTTTTSALPAFGNNSSFSIAPSLTTATNPPFAFGVSTSSKSMTPTLNSPMNTTAAPAFGTITPFSTTPISFEKSTNSFSTLTSSNPPPFSFGITSNTNQSSVAPAISTGGFSFAPQSSTAPMFGIGSSSLASNTYSFGLPPTTSASTSSFSFSTPATSSASNPFSTPDLPSSTDGTLNMFNIGSGGSPRPMLRARRRRNP